MYELHLLILTWNPSFCTILAYFLAASLESSSDFAPVQTIFPDPKISAVVLGSRILMMTAANRFGLYSAFLACSAIFLRSSLQPRLTVETMFCSWGTMPWSMEWGGARAADESGVAGEGGAGLAHGAYT